MRFGVSGSYSFDAFWVRPGRSISVRSTGMSGSLTVNEIMISEIVVLFPVIASYASRICLAISFLSLIIIFTSRFSKALYSIYALKWVAFLIDNYNGHLVVSPLSLGRSNPQQHLNSELLPADWFPTTAIFGKENYCPFILISSLRKLSMMLSCFSHCYFITCSNVSIIKSWEWEPL